MAPKRQAQAICKLNDNNANGRNPTIGFLPCFCYRLIIKHLRQFIGADNICKKLHPFGWSFVVFAIPVFPARAEIVAPFKNMPGGLQGSAACGGVKRPQQLGSRLTWRE